MNYEELFSISDTWDSRFLTNDIKKVYHYAPPEAFLNIIEHNKLWFTDVNFFLDKAELNYAFTILENVLNDLATNEIDENFKSHLQEYAKLPLTNEVIGLMSYDNVPPYKNLYVCCFSTIPDDIYMWNSYMKNTSQAGYCLGFNYQTLSAHINNEHLALFQYKVLYEKETQKEIIKNLIIKYNNWLIKYNTTDGLQCVLIEFL